MFIPACFALNMAFGPNNLLSVTYGAQRGIGFASLAGTARIAAFAPMIIVSALGLGFLLSVSAVAFNVLKVIGAVYLVYLGIRLLLSSAHPESVTEVRSLRLKDALRAEAAVALSNPKAILIFAAFFPQFVDAQNYWLSYAILGGLFLPLEAVAILAYGALGRLALKFAAKRLHWLQRGSGVGMITFGGLLLFAKQPSQV